MVPTTKNGGGGGSVFFVGVGVEQNYMKTTSRNTTGADPVLLHCLRSKRRRLHQQRGDVDHDGQLPDQDQEHRHGG